MSAGTMEIYVPLGHGGLMVRDSKYVMRTVPEGCVYITLAYSGALSYSNYIERFLEGLKDPEIYASFQTPFEAKSYVRIREFLEGEAFFNATGKRKLRKPAMEEHGVLSIKTEGMRYPEAFYELTSHHDKYTSLVNSGFYNAKDLIHKPIKKIYNTDSTLIKGSEIKERYAKSLIPSSPTLMEILKSDPSTEVLDDTYTIESVAKATLAWPLNLGENLQSIIILTKTILESLLAATSKREIAAARQAYRSHYEYLTEIAERIMKRLDDSEIKGTEDKEYNDFDKYPFMRDLIDLVESMGELKPAFYSTVLPQLIQKCDDMVQEDAYIQYPNIGVRQSFLFENFPGIHINMLCRAINPDLIPEEEVARQRAASAGNLAEMFNYPVARAFEGTLHMTPEQYVRYQAEHYPPGVENLTGEDLARYKAERAKQMAIGYNILSRQTVNPTKYARNVANRQQALRLIKELSNMGATDEYIRSIFPNAEVVRASPPPATVENFRRTFKGRNKRSNSSNSNGNIIFATPKLVKTRRRNRL